MCKNKNTANLIPSKNYNSENKHLVSNNLLLTNFLCFLFNQFNLALLKHFPVKLKINGFNFSVFKISLRSKSVFLCN